MKTKIYIYLIVFLAFLPISLLSTNDALSVKDTLKIQYDTTEIIPVKFNAAHIDSYKSDKDFDYTENKIKSTFWTKVKRWFYNILFAIFKWLFGQKKAVGYLSKFIKIIPYLGLAALIFLIVHFMFNINFRKYFTDKNAEAEVNYGEDEEIIRKKDIDAMLQDAIEKGNYRLALRYFYLKLLKRLEKNNIIKWEPQKTNFEYQKEIKNKDYNNKFNKFTLWYDYIWYGKYPLSQKEFGVMSKELDSFIKNLDK